MGKSTCPQGHSVDVPSDATLPVVCPICGASMKMRAAAGPGNDPDIVLPSLAPGGGTLAPTLLKFRAPETGVADQGLILPAPEGEERPTRPSVIKLVSSNTATVVHYEIIELIGRGGMGVVYKARQTRLNRVVALKMILAGVHASAEELARFRLEAEAVAQFQHPNIVQIFEVGEQEGKPYFSLEYVDGGSLAKKLTGQPYAPDAAARLVQQLADGIHLAHQRGIIHRDLKPANILLMADGTPKIADFGLAKNINDVSRTHSGAILGSPNYMSPEQAVGAAKLGPATDLYGLGAILYHLLTGQPPFASDSVLTILEQVQKDEVVPPRKLQPNVPLDLQTICLKCLEKEPARRYASAKDLGDDLGRFLADEPIKARPVGTLERFVKWTKRRPDRAALLVISLVASIAIAALVFANWRDRTPRREFHANEIRASAARVRRSLYDRLRSERTADGWFPANLSPDAAKEIDMAAHCQTLCAMLACAEPSRDELRELLPSLELPFAADVPIERDGVKYGWAAHADAPDPQAEPALWLAAALALTLGRQDLLTETERRRFEGHLAYTHEVLRRHRREPFHGGWDMYANAKPGQRHGNYTSGLALLTLLETRRAGLGWEGNPNLRDKLLTQTTEWLSSRYHAKAAPPGWAFGGESADQVLEGLTLRLYAHLLRSDIEAGIPMSPTLRANIPPFLRHVSTHEVTGRDFEIGESLVTLVDPDGKERVVKCSIRFEWSPWAIRTCVAWLEWASPYHGAPADVAEVEALLEHLLIDSADELATRGVSGHSFVAAERLYALSLIPPPAAQDAAKTEK